MAEDTATPKRVAIIGAGMAGLSCADALVELGHHVTLFDKGRGPGGRMSTRRIDTPLGEVSFDHGAQYFTARDAEFVSLVADWSARGIVCRWPAAGPHAWIGLPGMNAPVREMAGRHDTQYHRMVQGVARAGRGWQLIGEQIGSETFDAVLLAVPAEQAVGLLGSIDLAMARQALVARSQPCWTAMFAFSERLPTAAVTLRNRGLISWAASNSAKPGRAGPEAWVVQASGSWTSKHMETAPTRVEKLMLSALGDAIDVDIGSPIAAAVHRWRYAMSAGSGDGALWNASLAVGVCGDWLLGPRIECAWLSGKALAHAMAKY